MTYPRGAFLVMAIEGKCLICLDGPRQAPGDMVAHLADTHYKTKWNKRGCGGCPQTFDTRAELLNHLEDCHWEPAEAGVPDGLREDLEAQVAKLAGASRLEGWLAAMEQAAAAAREAGEHELARRSTVAGPRSDALLILADELDQRVADTRTWAEMGGE